MTNPTQLPSLVERLTRHLNDHSAVLSNGAMIGGIVMREDLREAASALTANAELIARQEREIEGLKAPIFVAEWFTPDAAPFGVPLWGYRLDEGKPWIYGVLALVERNNDEEPNAWFTHEEGEEIEPPVLWTHARVPSRPFPKGAPE